MVNMIQALIQDGALVEIHFYSDDNDNFCCGKIVSFDENYYGFVSFDPYGRYDGYLIKRIDDICRIDKNTKYLNALKSLIDNDYPDYLLFSSNEGLVDEALRLSIDRRKMVSLEITNSNSLIMGYVDSINNDRIKINVINEYGEADGLAEMFLEDIISISYDSLDERKAETLFNLLANQ